MKKFLLFLILGLFAINFASAATFTNVVSTCAAEDNAAKGSFAGSCDVVGGSSLQSDDTSLETHTYQKTNYGGVRIQSVNPSIVDCGAINSVNVCYKWWRTSGAAPLDCDISVDANGGASYTAATSTCTAFTSEPAGITCIDVTSLESWSCSNFFGASGTRAFAKSEMTRVTSGGVTTETGTWDTLYFNVTYTNNILPTINNISLSTSLIKGGNSMTIYANTTSNGVNDSNANSLTLYCSNSTQNPSIADNICSGTDATYPYDLTCTYNTRAVSANETVYCRVYDGVGYSTNVSATYTIDSSAPSLSIIGVAEDIVPGYFDTNGSDGVTSVNISGEANMLCRWGSSDVAYSSMVSSCTQNGIYATCNFTDVASQGSTSRYISCQDSLTNENNATNNLNVDFTLDYTNPTTSDNSVTSIQLQPYVVTITESDNVDTDPTTYYCTDLLGLCTPTTLIDNAGTITFTSLNRGVNYLRYYSVDDAGNTQSIQTKTININRLPNITSVSDNATTIKGGTAVNVSTISSDSDSGLGQGITLFVCNSTSATSSGCTHIQYCTASGTTNLSCIFASETDSSAHTWYAFLYDDLGEAATNNPLSGDYTSDSTAPTITIISPANTTYPSVNVTAEISTSESSVWAGYSLDGAANVTMTNLSSTSFTSSLINLAYGLHNITFYANDSLGNYGVSAIRYFTIETPVDVTAPSLTIVSPSNASYTNPFGTYVNVSSDETLSWAGYRLNGGSLTNLSNTSTTVWYVNLTSLSQESTNSLVVYGNDTSGNQGNRSMTFYADSLAPRYSLVSANPSIANVSQNNVNCSIFWNDTFSISSVIISHNADGDYENQSILFSGRSGVASYSINKNRLDAAGNYTCIFYATDSAGNMNSTATTFEVRDVTPPTITVTSPTNNGVYAQTSVDLSLVTNENASLAWFNNGTANITMDNTSSTSWNYTFNGTTDNVYIFTFYANDTSGNLGVPQTKTFNITIGTDSVPPVITISSIANASYKSLTEVALNVTTNENVSWVMYSLNDSANVSLTNTSMFNWNATLVDLAQESTNTLVVYANDTAGNIGSTSIIFYADTLAPRFSSANADSVNETQSTTCSVDITDAFNLSSVKISENATIRGTPLNHTIDLSTNGTANYTISNLAKGIYTCVFYATDLAGKTNSTSTTFNVSDVTSPVLTINSPIAQNYSSSSVLFSLTTNENVSSANYSLNGGANVSLVGSGVSWSKVSTIADGSYTVVFYANDTSGNVGSSSVSIVVDTSVNDVVAPTITVWSPLNNTYDLDGNITLNITSDEALSWVGYRLNGGNLTNLSNTTSTTNWNSSEVLTQGTYNITFYANDTSTNKNQGTRSSTVYVDLTNASANLSCDSQVNDSEDLVCSINTTDAIGLDYAILSYNFSGSFVNSSNIDLSGTSDLFNYSFGEGNYTPENYSVRLYVYDLSGRLNDTEIESVQVIDDTYPTISSISYSPNNTDALDPNVNVTINASVVEDYAIDSVKVYYRNGTGSLSSLAMSNTSLTDYNATIEFGYGNWTFYINATDAQRNTNVSSNYTFEVAEDISQNVTTNITSIKSFTYAQRSSTNELGYVILNTTSDTSLNYNVTISGSSIQEKFNLNNTFYQSENYTASNGTVLLIPVYVNLTEFNSPGLYPYNISVTSEAGTVLFERNLNIQTADGPYLVATVSQYSSSVTRGQTDVELVATVTNLGTADASGVVLTWSLPSVFTLTQGNLTRNLGSLPIGVSSTNTIKVSVSSSANVSLVNITATATATNLSSLDTKQVNISNVSVITITVPGTSSGGGGSGKTEVFYSKTVEVVRGSGNNFTIEVYNKYANKTLNNVSLTLTGFTDKYMQITPKLIDSVAYGEKKYFTVTLTAPSYKEYEEHSLKAVISGMLSSGSSNDVYSETQNIRLIIEEVSTENTLAMIISAEEAINVMRLAGFNNDALNVMLSQAKDQLAKLQNKKAYDLAQRIIQTKDLAFKVDGLIKSIDKDITGSEIGENKFASDAVRQMVDLAISAFERGDYSLAEQRINSAKLMLVLERKGNIVLFLYLYWKQVILALLILSIAGVFAFRAYKKKRISSRIADLNVKENKIQKIFGELQSKYFSGKMSSHDYHLGMGAENEELAKVRKERTQLRNKRFKVISGEQLVSSLESEKKEVETDIKKIQEKFYVEKKITEPEYKTRFEVLNDRLAEIESERLTKKLSENKIPVKEVVKNPKIKSQPVEKMSFFKRRKHKKEQELKRKVEEILSETKHRMYNGK